ncbi:hypothetical protein [Micromonospora sp. NPDC005806]|uniref:hypothetical protein n=1 Tax=Micromonospora sp. NPDC005806 TaxID=3364234 RepID=UPI003677C925
MKRTKVGASRGLGQHSPLRLMLLIALAFGVLGMHAFGHHPDFTDAGVENTMTDLHHTSVAPIEKQNHGGGSDGHGHGVDVFTVCLAVLGAGVVLASLSMLRRRRGELPVPAGAWPWRRSRGHDPPPRRPLGLQMSTVSVLRT